MKSELFILSCNRPELLACTLAGLCGFNAGYPVHVIDDGSNDLRVMALLARYREARLIESVEHRPRGGIGQIRRRMIDRFLANGADQLVQVEGDMLIAPGQVKVLLEAYENIKAETGDLHILNVVWFTWVRPCLRMLRLRNYTVAITRGMSEPFWTSDKASLRAAVDAGMIPADRPDLVLWVDRLNGATLLQPEINCQHIGAGKLSLLYDYFAWQNVVIRQDTEHLQDSGPLRQPYPSLPVHFPAFQDEFPASARRLYDGLRALSTITLPEFPA